MADNLKIAGLRLVIEGAAEFNSTISKVNSQLQVSSAEFSKLQAQYGKGANNIELLASKQKLLQDKLQATKDIQQQYNRILDETVKKYGENSVEADKVRAAIAKNEAEEIKLEKQLAAVTKELQIQSSEWTQFGQKCQTAGEKLQKVGDKVSSIGKTLSTRVTAPIVAAGTVAVKAAADLEDAMGATEQIFGKAADAVKDWADDLDTYYGIAEKDALAYVNTMGSMLQNIGGLAADEAASTGERLLELAGDLTAMYGGTVDDAVRALTGALKGNNTMLDNYGMAVNDALIKTKALEMGLMGEGEQLTLQAKQAATLALIYEQTAAAQGQAAREAEGASGSFRTLTTELKNLGADLGQILLPAVTEVVQHISQLVQKFSELSPETQEIIVKILALAAALGPVLLIGGKMISGIGTLVSGVGALSTAIGAASAGGTALSAVFAALTGPVGIVAAAVAALAAAFVGLFQTDEEFRASVIEGWEEVKSFFSELWTQIADIFSAAFELIKAIFQNALDALKQFWDNHGEAIKTATSATWEIIKTTIETVLTLISGIIKTITKIIQGDWQGAWETVKNTATTIWNNISSMVNSVFNTISTFIRSKLEEIKSNWKNAWENVRSTLQNAGEAIKSAISNIGTAIRSKFQEIINNARSWGQNLIQGFIQGIRDKIAAVRDAAASVVAAAKDFLGFNSPAKKGEGRYIEVWGANFVKGFITGMKSMRTSLQKTAASMSSAAVGGISSNTDNRSYSYGGITVQNMVVRDEMDIKLIAQELYRLQVRNARGRGVVA